MPFSDYASFPEMAVVRQFLESRAINDLSLAFGRALAPVAENMPDGRGRSVAVAVGSRHIHQLDEIVFQCLRFLEDSGFQPFIIPAMGSHGGATPAGQTQVLAGLNITEAAMQAPIIADMAVREVCDAGPDLPIFVSQAALDADFIVPINRIKPHTKFSGAIESGLCKMLTIGLGKAVGAASFHRAAVNRSFAIIEQAAARLLGKLPILFGLGLLEDGCGQLAKITPLSPETLIDREKALLVEAEAMMGSIPFDPVDILIIDQIGKDISGIGMDANVTGRHRDITGDFNNPPHVKRIFVRELSPASDGNANGIGLADVTTCRLVEQMDRQKTAVNAIAAISPEKAAIPMHFETDGECLTVCGKTTGAASPSALRVVRIRNTAALEYLQVSKPLASEVDAHPKLTRITPWQPLAFDGAGNLMDFIPHD